MGLAQTLNLLAPTFPTGNDVKEFRASKIHTAGTDARMHALIYIVLRELSMKANLSDVPNHSLRTGVSSYQEKRKQVVFSWTSRTQILTSCIVHKSFRFKVPERRLPISIHITCSRKASIGAKKGHGRIKRHSGTLRAGMLRRRVRTGASLCTLLQINGSAKLRTNWCPDS